MTVVSLGPMTTDNPGDVPGPKFFQCGPTGW